MPVDTTVLMHFILSGVWVHSPGAPLHGAGVGPLWWSIQRVWLSHLRRDQPLAVHSGGVEDVGVAATEALEALGAHSRADSQEVPLSGRDLRMLNGMVSCSELVFMWLLKIS